MAAADAVLQTIEPEGLSMPPSSEVPPDPSDQPSPSIIYRRGDQKAPSDAALTSIPGHSLDLGLPLSTRQGEPAAPPPSTDGPITSTMVSQAGLPNADDWASFANWLIKGEARNFRALYGKDNLWQGPLTAHPKDLGWSGAVGPDGRPTSAFGWFQDERDTWNNTIVPNYLGGDKSMTPEQQIRGNLLYADDLYRKRTGRELLADWKAGNTTGIASVLSDQWTSLKASPSADADAAFEHAQREKGALLDHFQHGIDELGREMARQSPDSAELHQLLRRTIDQSQRLAERFEKISSTPPQPMSPFEAASDFTPILIAMMSLGGLATRRPALGTINAMSGGLQGLIEGNDKNYKNAFDLWSRQSDLAGKAFDIQTRLLDSIARDIQLSETERQNRYENALRILGLDRDLALAKAGQWDEVWKRKDAMLKLQPEIDEKRALTARAWAEAHRAQAQAAAGGSTNPVMADYAKRKAAFVEENQREPTAKEDAELFDEALKARPGRVSSDEEGIKDAMQAKADQLQKPVDQLTAQERTEARKDYFGGKAGAQAAARETASPKAKERATYEAAYAERNGLDPEKLTASQKEAAQVEHLTRSAEGTAAGRAEGTLRPIVDALTKAQKARNAAAGQPETLTPDQETMILRQASTFKHQAGITGNEVVTLKQRADQYGIALNAIGELNALMDRHGIVSPTGLGGMVGRKVETAADFIGLSSDTDKRMFLTNLELLKVTALPLIEQMRRYGGGSGSRTDQHRLDLIARGESLGDTLGATQASMDLLQGLFTDQRRQTLSLVPPDQWGEWRPLPVAESPSTRSFYNPPRPGVAPQGPAGGNVAAPPTPTPPGPSVPPWRSDPDR